jgi:hypothetical protein
MKIEKLQDIHSEAEKILILWIGHVPSDWRARRSLELFSEAVGLLSSAALNLSRVDGSHPDASECDDSEIME